VSNCAGQWDPPDAGALHDELGVTTVILHQANKLNPYIDWPLHPSVTPALINYTARGRDAGVNIKVSIATHA